MSIKNLFSIFHKNEREKELMKKLTLLDLSIKELETALFALQAQSQVDKTSKTTEPPIIIEKINIEKIILDKYELNNNFGQLGIKELKGKLNIGATYGAEFTPQLDEEEKNSEMKQEKVEAAETSGPKINIKAKKD